MSYLEEKSFKGLDRKQSGGKRGDQPKDTAVKISGNSKARDEETSGSEMKTVTGKMQKRREREIHIDRHSGSIKQCCIAHYNQFVHYY